MMSKTPRIPLLTPDLDRTVTFIPGYCLIDQREMHRSSPTQIAAIALALWELSGEEAPQTGIRNWSLGRFDHYRGA